MKQIQMTKKELKRIYDLNLPSYELICKFGKELAERALRNEKVDLLHISSRVKSFESFFEKISRKKYPDPYGQIEDMCGVRIICFYSTDLDRVNKVIEGAFHLKEFIDKLDIQDADRFGYRSNHHIVRLPNLPEFSKFNEFKIEVQSRTVLMHAWAHIQGKLEYKEAEHTPKEFKRKLYQLSAILELADEQFQVLKFEKDALRKQLSA